MTPPGPAVLVAIPVFGSPELTDALLADLLRDPVPPRTRVVVVDNGGDYELPDAATGIELYRPGDNLRWIGTANWAVRAGIEDAADVVVVLNNDIRLSRDFLAGLCAPFALDGRAALVAACYDDFWLHQRPPALPASPRAYAPVPVDRVVPFCDGTALGFSVRAMTEIGLLDTVAFPWHGYGSDIDLALRAKAAGWHCVVTERAYVSHLRRGTMNRIGQTSEANRSEILDGMNGKWGDGWRAVVGLGPGAFPAHNTGSAASWYL